MVAGRLEIHESLDAIINDVFVVEQFYVRKRRVLFKIRLIALDVYVSDFSFQALKNITNFR